MSDPKHETDRILLTGLTGLVGSSIVVALARERRDVSFVCLVRGSGGMPAARRAQEVVRSECAFEGCPEACEDVLSRVSVIEGDVTSFSSCEINPFVSSVRAASSSCVRPSRSRSSRIFFPISGRTASMPISFLSIFLNQKFRNANLQHF